MTISNFKLVDVIGDSAITWRFKALVTVTTKRIFRKQIIEKKEVFKSYAGSWYFIESGEFADEDVSKLARKLEAELGKDLQYCLNT